MGKQKLASDNRKDSADKENYLSANGACAQSQALSSVFFINFK